jgi:hypothetical protein
VAVAAAAVLAGYSLVTARAWAVNWYRLSPAWVPLSLVVVIVCGWAYKLFVGVIGGHYPAPGS